ncbi:uncharacterized protein TRIADDRAFT_57148 [Trichoplax adhaerens]|uniref:BZIP domain-containing protein n=1 Tax=Trichoplax adhaerens TaxID=10228 RepID=B3S0R7_TRIAD|nr:hypothetical protein TRIADDRAFT_57148 [Trichoplax adhaerens]EDV23689.1 hypothetical protein TRIADDRAFT_57148 [Trichoplax adhaerens]|eukprot:XP_002113215.1 hypothetical protein TRIADDRAFT_57148 [Trichoplax adhaerens]
MQYLLSELYDGGISLSNSTACLSPPLDGSEEMPQDILDATASNSYDNAHKWLFTYDDQSAKRAKNDMDKSKKQAMAAKLNREKKKKYISELECRVKTLRESDKLQREKLQFAKERIDSLENEVSYLKSVLAHDSQLSKLLRNIPNTPDVQLDSSLLHHHAHTIGNQSKRKYNQDQPLPPVSLIDGDLNSDDDNMAPPVCCKKLRSNVQSAAGICLHVSEQKVTIELCSECSRKASSLNH